MISPEEILRKASRKYPDVLRDYVDCGDAPSLLFPLRMPCDLRLSEDLATQIAEVDRLRSGAKERRGFGYSVGWRRVNSPMRGKNHIPARVEFETRSDLLRLIGKQREFARFATGVDSLRLKLPEVLPWVRHRAQTYLKVCEETAGLIEVVSYLREHPRPDRFARELPLSVDTKFIERNQPTLRRWLDLCLPPEAVDETEEDFALRFGLRRKGTLVLVRMLDDALVAEAGLPCRELALPLSAVESLQVRPRCVVIVENEVSLLTLPPCPGVMALGGLGHAVTILKAVRWLNDVSLIYWGDIDPPGFVMLSNLRRSFPHVRSLLMDASTLDEWGQALSEPKPFAANSIISNLYQEELATHDRCVAEAFWIEQERFPSPEVARAVAAMVEEIGEPRGSQGGCQ
ncbi:Wadjet anti-phage system protein JetD domain-containing protein [Botrimarina mediterranea]|uniref:Wadjet protein JetD C-terminal domain-containing protein n=1 Tax=Botrimarina mediterranea TaxID=2528022 RepID=A0A518K7D1_9BACT|nr:Wadjet anti-phage system protein JetD domain-containing protein [Botrimarina mediterranea]QDV73713.1 hypothetical protein Spa11_19120 [Botrimarina mediterranea]QDV78303.1 hypothetical protein K2D_19100 [Planctomycetes bacterium K2D]